MPSFSTFDSNNELADSLVSSRVASIELNSGVTDVKFITRLVGRVGVRHIDIIGWYGVDGKSAHKPARQR